MISQFAKDKAAQAWQTPKTKKIEIIPELTEAFAEILEEILAQPWLGNATCEELLKELSVRIKIHGPGLDYSTTGNKKKQLSTVK